LLLLPLPLLVPVLLLVLIVVVTVGLVLTWRCCVWQERDQRVTMTRWRKRVLVWSKWGAVCRKRVL